MACVVRRLNGPHGTVPFANDGTVNTIVAWPAALATAVPDQRMLQPGAGRKSIDWLVVEHAGKMPFGIAGVHALAAHGIAHETVGTLEAAVPAALAGEFQIDARLAEVRASYPAAPLADVPTVVHIDNTASRDYTILEVSTADRRGLLYGITKLLHERGMDIHLAKVDTIGPEVVDAFYIRRANGLRIDDADEMERLRRAVLEVLEAL